eukprot:135312-Rhodomonas_salina.1
MHCLDRGRGRGSGRANRDNDRDRGSDSDSDALRRRGRVLKYGDSLAHLSHLEQRLVLVLGHRGARGLQTHLRTDFHGARASHHSGLRLRKRESEERSGAAPQHLTSGPARPAHAHPPRARLASAKTRRWLEAGGGWGRAVRSRWGAKDGVSAGGGEGSCAGKRAAPPATQKQELRREESSTARDTEAARWTT